MPFIFAGTMVEGLPETEREKEIKNDEETCDLFSRGNQDKGRQERKHMSTEDLDKGIVLTRKGSRTF